MESRGWRGHRGGPLGEDGLVTLAVGRFVSARDVRRQGNVTKAFDGLVQVAASLQPDTPQAVIAAPDYLGDQLPITEFDALAKPHFSAWPHQGFPFVLGHLPRKEYFDFGGQKLPRRAALAPRHFRADTGSS